MPKTQRRPEALMDLGDIAAHVVSLPIQTRRAPDEAEAFGWEARGDVWIMGALGEKLLRELDTLTPPQDQSVAACDSDVPFVQGRRRWCRMTDERKKPCCTCSWYTPVLAVPLTLFEGTECHAYLSGIAQGIVRNTELPRHLEEHRQNMVVQTLRIGQGFTPEFQPRRKEDGHLLRYKVNEAMRDEATGENARNRSTARVFLDRLEYEFNFALLPSVLRICEEFRQVKLMRVAEGVTHDYEVKTFMSINRGKPPGSNDADAPLRDVRNQTRSADGRLGRAKILCCCGHADTWHETPDDEAKRRLAIESPKTPKPMFIYDRDSLPSMRARTPLGQSKKSASLPDLVTREDKKPGLMLCAGRFTVQDKLQPGGVVPWDRSLPASTSSKPCSTRTKKGLPAGWQATIDPSHGVPYFWNPDVNGGEAQWERPYDNNAPQLLADASNNHEDLTQMWQRDVAPGALDPTQLARRDPGTIVEHKMANSSSAGSILRPGGFKLKTAPAPACREPHPEEIRARMKLPSKCPHRFTELLRACPRCGEYACDTCSRKEAREAEKGITLVGSITTRTVCCQVCEREAYEAAREYLRRHPPKVRPTSKAGWPGSHGQRGQVANGQPSKETVIHSQRPSTTSSAHPSTSSSKQRPPTLAAIADI